MTELKKKWIEALRSDKYDQVRNALKVGDNGYCCLGVLCELEGVGKFESRYPDSKTSAKVFRHPNGSHFEWIDGKAEKRFESVFAPLSTFEKVFPESSSRTYQNMLATLNDEGEYSFNQIADLIEEGPEAIQKAFESLENDD